MALTNREQVGRALDLLAEGLGPFVEREVRRSQARGRAGSDALRGTDRDVAGLLRVITDLWEPVFRFPLGPAERSLAHELRNHRNNWAHQKAFSGDDAFRVLDSAERLLTAVSAPQTARLAEMKDELLRQRFEERARDADRRRRKRAQESSAAVVEGLVPWRDVITPHEDVFSGQYQQAEFTADLHAVHANPGGTSPEYGQPQQFFRRTHLTAGLKTLLAGAAGRLTGGSGDPVVDLQTNFGGGKTHSMLALYHLFSGVAPSDLPGVDDLLREAGIAALPPRVRRVVLVGTKLEPAGPPPKPDGTRVRTFWGELAWQLGGREGYNRLRAADEKAVNPGAALEALLRDAGPCLILVDEWVAYARQLEDRSDLAGGSFETQFSFAQNLTECVKQAKNCLLVISLPASSEDGASAGSDEEVGGVRGRAALGRLRNVLGRVASSWKPATAEEGFEIVRRRLFEPIPGDRYKHRDQTARRFARFYAETPGAFPAECRETSYRERIEAAYPIHPEVFDRLYEDWASLLRFQRTRGVLRLMAAVIHALWESNDQSPLILPSMIPLAGGPVRQELTRYLEDPWDSILDQDVDGDGALPERLDREIPALGRVWAARRVARTVFLGSAPKVKAAQRGIEARRIRLGCAAPGQKPAVYDDALRRLAEGATYLYPDGSRYSYDTQPTVTKLARDRAEDFREKTDETEAELTRRLRAAAKERAPFAGVHVAPHSSADVPDEQEARLVILAPDHAYSAGGERDRALVAADEILRNRGRQPRHCQNALLFLAADESRFQDLDEALRRFLAWSSMLDEAEHLNLAPAQKRQAERQAADAGQRVEMTLPEAYCRLLVPGKEDAGSEIAWKAIQLRAGGGLVERAGARAAREELLLAEYGPSLLRQQLDGVPLWEGDHAAIRKLEEYFANLLEYPRLAGADVLASTITRGLGLLTWETDGFAFAEAYDEAEGRYRGLSAGQARAVSAGSSGLLVRPEAALRQLEEEREPTAEDREQPMEAGRDEDEPAVPDDGVAPPPPPSPAPPLRRYHGSVALDPGRLGPGAGQIAEEIVAHLAGLDQTTVEIRLEIAARRSRGFPEEVVRVVRENGATLRFESQGFEEE